ncbi:ATP-dependent DNA ligase [Shinella zoogloeoides]|uniref:ATP-dependent DNA ligase n=1 Tax=Shinella zoogloeoides TaxID=352475 RepID=UPI00273D0DE8|nr:RNA ligase family protein [Shinella zoogloeoides]WLR91032.1 RNA ligase family protein [Shinella zoogloeoides]
MDATQALDLIEKIAAEGSRNGKEELLAQLLATDIGKFIVKWSYDPFITYGIKPTRHASNLGEKIAFDIDGIESVLTKLAQRELTGNAAADVVTACLKASDETANELLWRILNKDLRCGIAESTIQKVMPGLIPVFAVMRAHHYEEKRIKTWPQVVEPKLDGYRFTFLCRDGSGGFFTRSGKRAPAAEHLVEPMIQMALKAVAESNNLELMTTLSTKPGHLGSYARSSLNFMVDGEMVVNDSFAEAGALRRKSETADGARFHVFDFMTFADFDATGSVGQVYMKRRELVEQLVGYADETIITKTPRYLVNSHKEIHDLYTKFQARGLEGAMVKDPQGLYDKKKSYGWLKIKAEETEDLPVVGAFPGEPGTKYETCLGGLIVDRNGVEVRVGGGFSDKERAELWDLWLRDETRMDNPPVYDGELELLKRLIEVEYHEVTPDGSLRHPRFKRFRDDKAGEIEDKEKKAA